MSGPWLMSTCSSLNYRVTIRAPQIRWVHLREAAWAVPFLSCICTLNTGVFQNHVALFQCEEQVWGSGSRYASDTAHCSATFGTTALSIDVCLNAQSLGAVENNCDVSCKRELVLPKFPVFHELCSHCIPVSYIIAGGKQHWPCTRRPLDHFQPLLQPTPAVAPKPLAEHTKALHAGQHLLVYPWRILILEIPSDQL